MVGLDLFFRQIKHRGDNFSYLIADENSRHAVAVDASLNADAIIELARKEGFSIKYVINTHHHRDHTAGNAEVKSAFGSKIVAHELSRIEKDVGVADGDVLEVGGLVIKAIHTPGHTPDSICLLVDNKLMTGDTLFVGECGRTDLPGGSAKDMYRSLFNKLMELEDEIEVYPGHDYGARPHSTIGGEKRTNYTLARRSLDDFIEFMKEP